MKLKFDSNLGYQLDAISSIVDLFDGLPAQKGAFEISLGQTEVLGVAETELGIGHSLNLDASRWLKNLHAIKPDAVAKVLGFPREFEDSSLEKCFRNWTYSLAEFRGNSRYLRQTTSRKTVDTVLRWGRCRREDLATRR